MMRSPAVILMTVVFALAAFDGASAQIIYGTPASFSDQIIYQNWKLTAGSGGKDTTVSQIVMPLRVYVPIAPHWEMHFNGAVSNSKLNNARTSTSVSSAGLSTVQVYRAFAKDRLYAAAGLVLPTGKTGYDTLQLPVAQIIANDYLNIPLKQLGGGFGMTIQTGGATQYNWLLYGGSVGYTYTGSYTYLSGGDKYNPGDEIVVQGSATAVGRVTSLDVDVSYKYYTADKVGSNQIFKAGGVASVVMTGRYDFGVGRASLSLAEIVRSKNSLQFGNALRADSAKANGNKSIVAGTISYEFVPQWSFSLLADYRLLAANGYRTTSEKYFGKSDLFSFGGGLEYHDASDRFSLTGKAVYSTGEANKDNVNSSSISISGFEFSVGGRVRL